MHTKGPWVWGEWTIKDNDRTGEPPNCAVLWTLIKGDESSLIEGPLGRKAPSPEHIIDTMGYECDGLSASAENMALIAAAPEMYEFIKRIAETGRETASIGSALKMSREARLILAAIEKGEGK